MRLFSPISPQPLLTLLSILLQPPIPPIHAQQIGSFFTAVQYNGNVPAGHSSCNSMQGGSGYCCPSAQSCAWDNGGHVACCPSGTQCQGSANGAGAAGGGCASGNQCQGSANNVGAAGGAAVVPIVPVSSATLLTPIQTQPVYTTPQLPTITVQPTPVVVVAGGAVGGDKCGGGGYITLTRENVGAAVITQGCYIIFQAGAERREGVGDWAWLWIVVMIMVGGLGV